MSIVKILVLGEEPNLKKVLDPFIKKNGNGIETQKSLEFVFVQGGEVAIQKITTEHFDYILTKEKICPPHLEELIRLILESNISLLCLQPRKEFETQPKEKIPASIFP